MRSRRSITARRRLADVSRLADGSLPPERRDEVEREIAGSDELRALLEREQRAVQVLHHARDSDRAPQQLRERIAAQQRSAPRKPARLRPAQISGAAVAIAAVVVALVLALGTGGPGAPTVAQAAALAGRGASQAAPTPDAQAPAYALARSVGEVYFPNWKARFGWRATGQRSDRLLGHRAVTVYYERGKRVVAYTIVSIPALAQPDAPAARVAGVELRSLRIRGRTVITWRRAGRTCVLSSNNVPPRRLEQLAAWHD